MDQCVKDAIGNIYKYKLALLHNILNRNLRNTKLNIIVYFPDKVILNLLPSFLWSENKKDELILVIPIASKEITTAVNKFLPDAAVKQIQMAMIN